MTVGRAMVGVYRAVFSGGFFALCSVVVCFLGNSIFGSSNSLWYAAALGTVVGLLMPIWSFLLERLPVLPDRSKHKQRLRELQAEREVLAWSENESD